MDERSPWILAVLLAILLSGVGSTLGADEGLPKALAAAVEEHESGAPDAAAELALVDRLAKLGEETDSAWLPDFWASYLLSQVVMRHSEDRAERIARAQTHLDRARQRAASESAATRADVLALQSLIHSFALGGIEDEGERDRVQKKAESALEEALALAPESPVVMVHAGTDLIKEGQKEGDWAQLIGGHALLRQALEIFESDPRPRGLTTHYNSEWVRPWSDWVYRMYAGGFAVE
ncbi:MAG: hypothetical protein AAF604_03645 [Acidobacteriota bacterium]